MCTVHITDSELTDNSIRHTKGGSFENGCEKFYVLFTVHLDTAV